MGVIILMKTWCEVVRPKQRTPNWYVLFLHHEAKITTRIVMNRNLQVGVLQSQRDHPVAWVNGTKD